jgi:uncharacterized protein (DUF1778 family)
MAGHKRKRPKNRRAGPWKQDARAHISETEQLIEAENSLIGEGGPIVLTRESWDALIDMIENPPEPTEALVRLLKESPA